MSFADWMKRSKIFTATQRRLNCYSPITDICRAAYKAGERDGRKQAEAIIAQKDAEIIEQCRINGMGAERELALLGKVAQQSAAPTPPVSEDRKDAERYRFVRAKPEMLLHLSNKEFDAAIDKAMQEDKP